MSSHDVDYYARRAQQERESAERSEDSIARRVHQEMAERYHARIDEIATIETRQQA